MNDFMHGVPSFLLRNARVIDGTGGAAYEADLVVSGERISAILPPGHGAASRVIDAKGLVVAPGFIDSHSHDDQLLLVPHAPHPKLSQGVTTVVTGNCGISLAPLVTNSPPAPLNILGESSFVFSSFTEYLDAIDQLRPALNVAPLIGHTTLRVKHMANVELAANAAELASMQLEVRNALVAGAFGMSTGVYYPPARAATTQELQVVAQPLRDRSAILAMHIRDEGDHIDEALREALAVGASSGARLVLSHHKVVGKRNHGRTQETLSMVAAAAAHQDVCMDCYPYEASSTMLDPKKAAHIGDVLISWSQAVPDCAGRTLKSIASEWGVSLGEAAQRLMPGGAIYFGMAEADVERVLAHPLTMIGSDGLPHDAKPHPRLWGSFPRVFAHYVRERRLFSLEAAIHKMSGLPARRFGLHDRGVIEVGKAADLVLFDPAVIKDNATYLDPAAAPSGIEAVFVNGQLALWRGECLDLHAGKRLRPQE